MGLMTDGLDFVADALLDAAGIDGGVTISRGYSVTRNVPCIRLWKPSEIQRPESQGPVEQTETRYEFMIPADEYKIDGTAVDPQVSDRIVDPLGTFEVAPSGSRADFYLRPDGMLRIRTLRLDT